VRAKGRKKLTADSSRDSRTVRIDVITVSYR
jgi:hypothetical protein